MKREKRTTILSVRVSPEEACTIRERARLCGRSVSPFLRETALGSVPRAKPRKVEMDAVHQLARIGNNLNQIARAANATRRVELSRRLEETLSALRSALEALI